MKFLFLTILSSSFLVAFTNIIEYETSLVDPFHITEYQKANSNRIIKFLILNSIFGHRDIRIDYSLIKNATLWALPDWIFHASLNLAQTHLGRDAPILQKLYFINYIQTKLKDWNNLNNHLELQNAFVLFGGGK